MALAPCSLFDWDLKRDKIDPASASHPDSRQSAMSPNVLQVPGKQGVRAKQSETVETVLKTLQ